MRPSIRTAFAVFPVTLATLALLMPMDGKAATASPGSGEQTPHTLVLPDSREATVRLPDVALPLANPHTPGRISLADLEGEKYILHVFASW